jgi:hypothetical protein
MSTGSRTGWPPIRWIELAAVLPATVALGPLMLYGGVGMVFAMIGAVSTHGATGWWIILPMVGLLGQMWVGALSIACLWIPLLIGVETLRQKPVLRWMIISVLVFGLVDAAYFLLVAGGASKEIRSSATSILMWAAMLGLPMLVGARYVYLLLTRPVPLSALPRSSGESQPKL